MTKIIIKAKYGPVIRYWVFGEQFVERVYEEIDGVLRRNEYAEWTFDDMTVQELINADLYKYPLSTYVGTDAIRFHLQLMAKCSNSETKI